jgi:aminoglycoside 3-N-acetyltransferase
MRSAVYHLLRRTLTQSQRNRLKRRVAVTRQRLAPLYVLRHGRFGAHDLRAELERRLPADFEILMVHCSLNDLRPMYRDGPAELLRCLLDLCGPDRTLAMPAFFFGGPDGDPEGYYRTRPRFDVRRQPSEMGLLSEVFRRREGVRRSMHPTHSVCALGPLAEELTARHHLADTTFGEATPFGVMAARRTAILGIGTEYFRCLTQVHAAEDLLGARYPIAVRPALLAVSIKDANGHLVPYSLPMSTERRQWHIEMLGDLLGRHELVRWRFHGAPFFMTTATRVTEALMDAALEGRTIYDPPAGRLRRLARAGA